MKSLHDVKSSDVIGQYLAEMFPVFDLSYLESRALSLFKIKMLGQVFLNDLFSCPVVHTQI